MTGRRVLALVALAAGCAVAGWPVAAAPAGSAGLRSGAFDPPRPAPDFALPTPAAGEFRLSRPSRQGRRRSPSATRAVPTSVPPCSPSSPRCALRLGAAAKRVQVVYVSVDPERDTPAAAARLHRAVRQDVPRAHRPPGPARAGVEGLRRVGGPARPARQQAADLSRPPLRLRLPDRPGRPAARDGAVRDAGRTMSCTTSAPCSRSEPMRPCSSSWPSSACSALPAPSPRTRRSASRSPGCGAPRPCRTRSPGPQSTAGGYVTIVNRGTAPDALVSARPPTSRSASSCTRPATCRA